MAITADELTRQLRELEEQAATGKVGRKKRSAPAGEGAWQQLAAELNDVQDAARSHEMSVAREVVASAGALDPAARPVEIITAVPGSGRAGPGPVPAPPIELARVPETVANESAPAPVPAFEIPSAAQQQAAAGYEVIDPVELEHRICVQDVHIETLEMALTEQHGDASFLRAQLEGALEARAQAYAALQEVARTHAAELAHAREVAQDQLGSAEEARVAAEEARVASEEARVAADARIAELTARMQEASRSADERIQALSEQLATAPAAEDVAALRQAHDDAVTAAAGIRAKLEKARSESARDASARAQVRQMQSSLAQAHTEASEAARAEVAEVARQLAQAQGELVGMRADLARAHQETALAVQDAERARAALVSATTVTEEAEARAQAAANERAALSARLDAEQEAAQRARQAAETAAEQARQADQARETVATQLAAATREGSAQREELAEQLARAKRESTDASDARARAEQAAHVAQATVGDLEASVAQAREDLVRLEHERADAERFQSEERARLDAELAATRAASRDASDRASAAEEDRRRAQEVHVAREEIATRRVQELQGALEAARTSAPDTLRELTEDLAAAVADLSAVRKVGPMVAVGPPRGRGRRWLGAAAVLAVLLAGSSSVWMLTRPDAGTEVSGAGVVVSEELRAAAREAIAQARVAADSPGLDEVVAASLFDGADALDRSLESMEAAGLAAATWDLTSLVARIKVPGSPAVIPVETTRPLPSPTSAPPASSPAVPPAGKPSAPAAAGASARPTAAPTSKPTTRPTTRPEPRPTVAPRPTTRPTAKPSPKPTTKPTPSPKPTTPARTPQTHQITLTCHTDAQVTATAVGVGDVKVRVSGAAAGSRSGSRSASTTVTVPEGGRVSIWGSDTGQGLRVKWAATGSCVQG